jgi:hypothetical protein
VCASRAGLPEEAPATSLAGESCRSCPRLTIQPWGNLLTEAVQTLRRIDRLPPKGGRFIARLKVATRLIQTAAPWPAFGNLGVVASLLRSATKRADLLKADRLKGGGIKPGMRILNLNRRKTHGPWYTPAHTTLLVVDTNDKFRFVGAIREGAHEHPRHVPPLAGNP